MWGLFKSKIVFLTVALTSASLSRYYNKEVGKRAAANITDHALFLHKVQENALQLHCMFQCERNAACRAVNVGKNNTCELIFSPLYSVLDDSSFTLLIGDYRCPEGFANMFNTGTPNPIKTFIPSCYKTEKSRRTREQAQLFCDIVGSHLVTIETELEQTHIVTYLNLTGISSGIWTSGYDSDLDGTWRWTSPDADMNYENWFPGEPGNNKGNERCSIMYKPQGFKWADVPCDFKYYIVCEKAVNFCD